MCLICFSRAVWWQNSELLKAEQFLFVRTYRAMENLKNQQEAKTTSAAGCENNTWNLFIIIYQLVIN